MSEYTKLQAQETSMSASIRRDHDLHPARIEQVWKVSCPLCGHISTWHSQEAAEHEARTHGYGSDECHVGKEPTSTR